MPGRTIRIVAETLEREEFSSAVDEEIARFDTFFQSLGNEPLAHSERAVIKTFLWFEIREGK